MVDRAMTVQELIDALMMIEDKSKPVEFYLGDSDDIMPIFDVVEHLGRILLYDY